MNERSGFEEPERPSVGADVAKGYRLFLAREPEARSAVVGKAGCTLTSLIAAFLASDEFKTKLDVTGGRLVMSETMLLQLDPDLLAWAMAINDEGLAHNDQPVDRLTVIRTFLKDDRIRQSNEFGDDRDFDLLIDRLAQFDESVDLVRTSALFDKAFYEDQLPAGMRVADPAAHYVMHGEGLGLKASAKFDAASYAELNSDVSASDFNRLIHFVKYGFAEGRFHRDWLIDHEMPVVAAANGRPTVLLLLHEATYTGAPILGFNLAKALSDQCNVVVVLKRGGPLDSAFSSIEVAVVAAPPREKVLDPYQMQRFAAKLQDVYQPTYAIANSVETRSIAVALGHCDIPLVALIHEFWPGTKPTVQLEFYANCSALVFPSRIVEQSSLRAFRETALQNRFILPQGPSAVPPFGQGYELEPCGPAFVDLDDTPASLDTLLTNGLRYRVGRQISRTAVPVYLDRHMGAREWLAIRCLARRTISAVRLGQ